MLFHTLHKGREEREMWVLFLLLFLLLSIRAAADSGQRSRGRPASAQKLPRTPLGPEPSDVRRRRDVIR